MVSGHTLPTLHQWEVLHHLRSVHSPGHTGFEGKNLQRSDIFITNRLSSFSNFKVVAAVDLLVGDASVSEIKEIYMASWGVVHGYNAAYTRMALSLTYSYLSRKPAPLPAASGIKRPRTDSSVSFSNRIPVLSGFRPPPNRGNFFQHGSGGENYSAGSKGARRRPYRGQGRFRHC
jgi:hypothetical protein